MAFAGVSLIVDGELCDFTLSPVDAGSDSGYHLLVVQGFSRTKSTTPDAEYIKSRPFLIGGHRWIVKYNPNICDKDDQKYMGVFLELDEDVSQGAEAQFTFSFIDEPELRGLVCSSKKWVFSTNEPLVGIKKFMQHEVLERSRHLKNDSFVIRCDVVVVMADNNTEKQGAGTTAPVLSRVPPSDMKSQYYNLLLSKEGADITLEVGGEKFTAHRFVLAARSTVFRAQLFGALDDGASSPSVLRINDIQAGVFRILLIFIYTDALSYEVTKNDGAEEEDSEAEEETSEGEEDEEEEDSEAEEETSEGEEDEEEEDSEAEEETSEGEEYEMETVFWLDLLEAAGRYDLQKLKTLCEEMLGSYICATTVADIIVVAERSGCRWLKECCLEFIKYHTSLHKVFTADCLDVIIRTSSPSSLKELISKFPAP